MKEQKAFYLSGDYQNMLIYILLLFWRCFLDYSLGNINVTQKLHMPGLPQEYLHSGVYIHGWALILFSL